MSDTCSRRVVLQLPGLLAAKPCGAVAPTAATGQEMARELERLRRTLGIPQLSALVAERGTVVWLRHLGATVRPGAPVEYPIASLTKPFTAALAFRLGELGRLSLDSTVDRGDGVSVSLRHLLSHRGAGRPGTRFLYSSELFRRLRSPLELAAGLDLAQALSSLVLRPSGLHNTREGATLSAASGLLSTVEDVVHLTTQLERGRIVSLNSLARMFEVSGISTRDSTPYAYGWFVQRIGREEVRWHFGQQADASSLLLWLPHRRLTFVVLARGDRLSSPFWLQMGDLLWSPAAVAFLSGWARVPIEDFEARRLMLDALIALAIGDRERATRLATRAAGRAPTLLGSDDHLSLAPLSLLAAFARSGASPLRELGRSIARRTLALDPGQPRALVDLAVLNLQDGHAEEARKLLQRVIESRQASPEIDQLARELLREP